uniref:Uncharacterized protein n=1 Tax=Leersia perrieri TaxID=77586 RepID=A0A0D9WKJ3_9ORYZ
MISACTCWPPLHINAALDSIADVLLHVAAGLASTLIADLDEASVSIDNEMTRLSKKKRSTEGKRGAPLLCEGKTVSVPSILQSDT